MFAPLPLFAYNQKGKITLDGVFSDGISGALGRPAAQIAYSSQNTRRMTMAELVESLEMIFKYVVEICTTCLELAGIIVLVSTAFICFIKWLRRDRENIRLDLAQGIALALEFKMGGEVLRTVVVREMGELLVLGAIILLRAAMTFLIHWEIVNEKKEMKEEAKARAAIARAKRKKPVRNTQGNHDQSADTHTDTDKGEDAADYIEEVEMTYEDNFRRPSLGRPASHKDEKENTIK